jgi:hypothetical protein
LAQFVSEGTDKTRLAFLKFRCKSNFPHVGIKYVYDQIFVYTRKFSSNPNCSTLEPDRPQHGRPAACVIAQQYSSATSISLRFHFGKEKLEAPSKIFYSFHFLNWLSPKLRTLELNTSGIAVFSKRTVEVALGTQGVAKDVQHSPRTSMQRC